MRPRPTEPDFPRHRWAFAYNCRSSMTNRIPTSSLHADAGRTSAGGSGHLDRGYPRFPTHARRRLPKGCVQRPCYAGSPGHALVQAFLIGSVSCGDVRFQLVDAAVGASPGTPQRTFCERRRVLQYRSTRPATSPPPRAPAVCITTTRSEGWRPSITTLPNWSRSANPTAKTPTRSMRR